MNGTADLDTGRLGVRGTSGEVHGVVESLITRRDELARLAPEWNALLARSAAHSIFLTWEWISTWLSLLDDGTTVLVATVRDNGGRLIAVAPFHMRRMELLGFVPFQCLQVLGNADAGADYPDLIVERGAEEGAIPRLARALDRSGVSWDCVWLPFVSGWTGARERFEQLSLSGGFHFHEREVDFGAIALPKSHAAYLDSLPQKVRTNLRRYLRRHVDEGDAGLRRCATQDDLSAMLPALFDLHRRRWQLRGEDGSFVSHRMMARFCERFAPIALRNGWLRLYGLGTADALRAVQYGYAYDGRFLSIQEGIDPDALQGAGHALRNLVVEKCIDEGLHEYDFLGEFSDHKRRWGAERRIGCDLFIGRRSLKNSLLFTRPVWPTGRFMRSDELKTAEV